MPPTTLAVVDLGSNSFRLEVGRVEGDQIYRLDTLRETLRLGAGLDVNGRLKPAARKAALACLARFGERLSAIHPSAVRAVATNTFRVARDAREFLPQAERALGAPIDVISGHEEARLIYLGAAHELPRSDAPRLVVDIGGGSTELIVGRGFESETLESLAMGCVDMTRRFFPDGAITLAAMNAAETFARAEVEGVAKQFGPRTWQEAYASSGTAAALADILESNGFSAAGITPEGLARLRRRMLAARHHTRLQLAALKPERAPVLAGGLAIMSALVDELQIPRLMPVGGALRLGVLYDLLGRRTANDARATTVERFIERYHIDRAHAARVAALATRMYREVEPASGRLHVQLLEWAAMLHEIGMSVSHAGFHKHGAYILQHADMPGFSAGEQGRLALLVFGCRGSLAKIGASLEMPDMRTAILALRLAVLFHRARREIKLPRIRLRTVPALGTLTIEVSSRWLGAHPLTAHLLDKEREEWKTLGYPLGMGASGVSA